MEASRSVAYSQTTLTELMIPAYANLAVKFMVVFSCRSWIRWLMHVHLSIRVHIVSLFQCGIHITGRSGRNGVSQSLYKSCG
jgi:hypothetical protein